MSGGFAIVKRAVKNVASNKIAQPTTKTSVFKGAITHRAENDLSDALGLNFPLVPVGSAAGLSINSLAYNTNDILLTFQPWLLTNAYRQYGVVQSIIDTPVNDAFRGGLEFTSDTLDIDDIDILTTKMDEEGDWDNITAVMRWGRLFGAGELLAFTKQMPGEPMNPQKLFNKDLEFYATDRWECPSTNPRIAKEGTFLFHDQVFHPSRVFMFSGRQQPYYLRIRLQGYGASILEQIIPPLLNYLKAQNVTLELLDEAKIDVLKVFDLAKTLLSKDGTAKVKKRVDIAARNKDYKSMLTIDSQDDYLQKQLTFAGIAEMLKEIRFLIASEAKMPVSKLFGIGSHGFSSGEDDLENYNAMVENDVRFFAMQLIKYVTRLRCFQLFGREVPDLKANWKPLRLLSDTEEQVIKTQKIQNTINLQNAGNFNRQESMEFLKTEEVIVMETEALAGKVNDTISLDEEKETEDHG